MHQAITTRGDTAIRAKVITQILAATPQAAAIKNGFGSLPLHVIAQRNTKMNVNTKERLMFDLVEAYPEGLTETGGKGKRTPLHVLFTDYVSTELVEMMVSQGPKACFMEDKNGYLPLHVACSRHCSPAKLKILLAANPESITSRTANGSTPLSLARSTATKSHPNNRLIAVLEELLQDQKKMPAKTCSRSSSYVAPVSPEPSYVVSKTTFEKCAATLRQLPRLGPLWTFAFLAFRKRSRSRNDLSSLVLTRKTRLDCFYIFLVAILLTMSPSQIRWSPKQQYSRTSQPSNSTGGKYSMMHSH